MVKLIKDDGGMAFPRVGSFEDPQTVYGEHGDIWFEPGVAQSERGLSMRDYFAAKIICALIIARDKKTNCDENGFARDSYRFADAMIEAKK